MTRPDPITKSDLARVERATVALVARGDLELAGIDEYGEQQYRISEQGRLRVDSLARRPR